MLYRKIDAVLLDWKNSDDKTPLIIKGCRQCGKTFSVMQFAEKNYKHVVYINFFENKEFSSAFEGALDVDTIVMNLSSILLKKARFVPYETCIILDELQECGKARTALKFFKLDGRYDVICTGSLLGVKGYGDEPVSIPVGYETTIQMFPLDFEEFLWANGVDKSITDYVEKCFNEETPVNDTIHTTMRNLLLQYVVVGGMPNVVSTFVSSHDFRKVQEKQRNIVNAYKDDMVKYASKDDKSCIRECFESIPKQLSKENKKFQYSVVKKGGSASKFLGSIQWIDDAGITNRCYNLSTTELPLAGNSLADVFKVYMVDSGLFISMLEDDTYADVLQGDLYGYKGAIFENLIADVFTKMGRKLYYFHKDSGLEIDFVTKYKGKCTLVEVKANNGNVKATKTILKHPEIYHVYDAIKLGNYNVGRENGILTLPSYMAYLLR
ncbi:MAG: ATP-binding protein [Paludibacteraceae bacterium]|nr:ATP-binding protein [Paludibacteraceae bacterium]